MTELSRFIYELPQDRIAQIPVEPRDSARLLDARDLTDHTFTELPQLLQPGDLVVVNETRVRRARLVGVKEGTGGAVEALLLERLSEGGWRAMVRPARRLRPGVRVKFGPIAGEVLAGPVEGMVTLDLTAEGDIEAAIERAGSIPLPPYFTGELPEDERYQTMFARLPGSSAAPTAGLHFTPRVLDGLGERGIEVAKVELHVGTDTFRPIATPRIEDHVMHAEWCRVPPETAAAVESCRRGGGRVVAVGTTTVRTLESLAGEDGLVSPGETETRLFLTPGTPIKVVDLLVTNFHLPRSTLLVLLEAFMGPLWTDVYAAALQRNYRFLSFGDAMLCARYGLVGK